MICPPEIENVRDGATDARIDVGPVWACIRTHPKHEHIAAAQLSHVPDVQVFNPQLRLERQTRRGLMRSTESLFVNYLFARFVIETTLEQVRYTPSVNRPAIWRVHRDHSGCSHPGTASNSARERQYRLHRRSIGRRRGRNFKRTFSG